MQSFSKDFHAQLSNGKDNLDMVVSYTTSRGNLKTSYHKLLYEKKHYAGIPLVLDPLFDSGGVLRRVEFSDKRCGAPTCAVCLEWFNCEHTK